MAPSLRITTSETADLVHVRVKRCPRAPRIHKKEPTMMRSLRCLACALLFLVACSPAEPAPTSQPSKPAVVLANKMCPVMPEHAAGTDAVVEFEGKKVGFCCPDCIETWNKFSDEEKRAKSAH